MAEDSPFVWDRPEFRERRTIDLLCREFEDAWHSADRLSIESFAGKIDARAWTTLLTELIACEWELRERSGDRPTLDEYAKRFPHQHEFLSKLAASLSTSGSASGSQPSTKRVSSREFQSGDEFAGFRIIRLLGFGGMGTVYQATIPAIGHTVALKILDCTPRHFESVAVRFEQEARLLSRLSDPGIVPLHSYGESEGLRYLVMKFISGVSLADVLAKDKAIDFDGESSQTEKLAALVCTIRTPGAEGRDELLLDLSKQLADALDVVHKAGILHRDIKPSNILLTPEGKVILTDFGLARDEQSAVNLTQGGEFLGTPRYAAPETLDGNFTRQSDLYSLGLVLFEIFSGKTPFESRGLRELLRSKLAGNVPEMSQGDWAPPDIEHVIRGLLHASADKRTPSANILVSQLAECRFASTVSILRLLKRHSIVGTTLGLVVLGLGAFSTLSHFAQSSEEDPGLTARGSSSSIVGNKAITKSEFALFAGLRLRQQFQLPAGAIPEHLAISDDASTVLVTTRSHQIFLGDAVVDELKSISVSTRRQIASIGVSNEGKYAFLTREDGGRPGQPANGFFVESWSIRDLTWTPVSGPPFESTGASPEFIGGFSGPFPSIMLIPHKGGPTMWMPDSHGYPQFQFLGEDRIAAAAHSMTTAAATPRGTIEILKISNVDPVAEPETSSIQTGVNDIFALRFSPDGRFLVGLGSEELVIVAMEDQTVKQLPLKISQQPRLSFAANGRSVAVWNSKDLNLIQLTTKDVAGQTTTTDDFVHVGALSSGREVVVAYASGRICVIEFTSGYETLTMESRGPRILAADYSDTTRQLAVGTVTGSIECLEIAPDVTLQW